MKKGIEFYERQRVLFKAWYALLALIVIDGIFIWGFVQQIIFGKPWGNNPMSNTGLFIVLAFIILFSIFMLSCKLDTIINDEGVYVRYFPFHFRYKFFPWQEINKVELKSFSPIRDLGGWGIRRWKGKRVYTVLGKMGFELTLENGKAIIIGTQRPQEVDDILKLREKNNNLI